MMETIDENNEKYPLRYNQLIQYQMIQTNIIKIVW